MQAVTNLLSKVSGPEYLTGNKAAIDAYLDKFDVSPT